MAGRPRHPACAAVKECLRKNPQQSIRLVAQKFGLKARTVLNYYHEVFPERKAPSVHAHTVPNKDDYASSNGHASTNGHVTPDEQFYEARRKARWEREAAIIRYANQHPGLTRREIADRLGFTYQQVEYVVARENIKVAKAPVGPPPGHGDPYRNLRDLSSERCQILQRSIEEDWTLDQTGRTLGVTRERARQLRNLFKEIHPAKAKVQYVNAPELAQQLGVSIHIIKTVARMNGIGRPRGWNQVQFSPQQVEELKAALENYLRRECPLCKKVFRAPLHCKGRVRFCGPECRKVGYSLRNIGMPQNPYLCHTYEEGLRRVLRIRNRPTKYVPAVAARRASGLSPMQLTYLRAREMIRTIPHPEGRKRLDAPHHLYSLEDAKIFGKYRR